MWKVAFNVVQTDDRDSFACEQLVANALHLAAELEIRKVPAAQRVRLELQIVSLALEIEQRHHLLSVTHCVRNHGLAVDPNEAALVVGRRKVGELLVAHIQKLLELLCIGQSHDEILHAELLLSKALIAVPEVDFVEEARLDIGDVVAADARTVVQILMQHIEILVEQFLLHNTHRAIFLRLSNDVWNVNFPTVKRFPSEVSLETLVIRRLPIVHRMTVAVAGSVGWWHCLCHR